MVEMNNLDNILDSLDSYFENAPDAEIKADADFINKLSKNGISLENYLENLNVLTSVSLTTSGICDDIAFSDFFNKTISEVQMLGNAGMIETGKASVISSPPNFDMAGSSNFAMAA